MSNETNLIDIDAFDAVADSASGFEFELLDKDGITGTGIFVTVQGSHSDEVAKWNSAIFMAAAKERQLAEKAGKQIPIKSLDEIHAKNIEGCALRVIAWRPVKQAFSRELMQKALHRNPHWIAQIIRQSDELGNFTPKKSAN